MFIGGFNYFLVHGERNDTKITFCNGNKIIDQIIIPVERNTRKFKQHVKKYLPPIEAKLAKFVMKCEQDKVLRMLEKMEQ